MLKTGILDMLKSLPGSDHCALKQCFQPNIDARQDSFATTCSRSFARIHAVEMLWKVVLVKVEIQQYWLRYFISFVPWCFAT